MKIRLGLLGFTLCAAVYALWAFSSLPALPSYGEVRRAYMKSDSLLLDRHGERIHEIRIDRNGRRLEWIPLERISPALQQAVVQAEDQRFYEHSGVDLRSVIAALLQSISSAGLRGASTISMQLSAILEKDLRPGKGRRSFGQKGRQALAAMRMEASWSKDEILEAYLNLVAFRGELQGIGAAARGLFGKDPHGLDRAESLLTAALIRSPGAAADDLTRRAVRLGESLKWLPGTEEIASKVRHVFLRANVPPPRNSLAAHVARRLMKGRPAGSTLACTLDGDLQQFALDRLVHHLHPLRTQNVRDGAVLIAENETGEVLAYVSYSGDPSLSRFVDGVQAKRQAGSTLKPFLYALAFDLRLLTPASLLDDSPLDVPVFGGVYHPRNYEGRFQGLVPVRVALASSLNVPAVRTLGLIGEEIFLSKLRALGVKGLQEAGDFYGPALALGSADVSLWELVNGYRTLANGGVRRDLHLIPGRLDATQENVFSPEASFLVADILSDRQARSFTFGLENALATRFWTAVKTGTSKDMRDNWCIGFSRRYTVGVWVGNFSGEPMWNVTGISGAAPVWIEMMNWLHRRELPLRRETPAGLVKAGVNGKAGPAREEWFIRGTEPFSEKRKGGSYHSRILYPSPGTIFVLDPDIPQDLQRIFFISQSPENGTRWRLNGTFLPSRGKATPWRLNPGNYHLALVDEEDRVLDALDFTVRGPRPDCGEGKYF
jgi:penicillin-binding protein 1C